MEKVEIRGNNHHQTIGILVKKGNLEIRNCRIHSHMMGGILI